MFFFFDPSKNNFNKFDDFKRTYELIKELEELYHKGVLTESEFNLLAEHILSNSVGDVISNKLSASLERAFA